MPPQAPPPSDRYRPLPPPGRGVRVTTDDGECPGLLQAWRLGPSGWEGYCSWTVGVGMTHVGWLPAYRLRPTDTDDGGDSAD